MDEARQKALDEFLGTAQAAPQEAPTPEAAAVEAATPPEPQPASETTDPRKAALDQFLDQQRREGVAKDVADMVDAGLEGASIDTSSAVLPSDTVGGWLQRAARSATFGAGDLISAKILQAKLSEEIPDITFAETLGAIRDAFEDDTSETAELAGFVVPGAAVGKGVNVAFQAAGRAGLAKGALRWAARQPALSRIVGAAGQGVAAGAVEEGVRTSVDESIGTIAGDTFDPDRVIDATITGALVGGVVGGGLQTAARGAGPVPGVLDVWDRVIKQGLGLGETQSRQAALRIFNAAKIGNEAPEETAKRLQDSAMAFARDKGRAPAMSDIMAPEDVRDVADIARFFSGLDRTNTRLAGESVDRAVESFNTALRSGLPLKAGEQLDSQVEDLFAAVSRKFGQTPVAVSDEVIDALEPSQAWIAKQSVHNPGAREIERVMTARRNIEAVRRRVGNLRNARNAAVTQSEVAKLDDEINTLLSNPSTEGAARSEVASLGGGDDALGALRNLRNMLAVKVRRMQASGGVARAEQALGDLEPTLAGMERALDDFRANGLKISLKDANHMRAAASRFASRSQDLAEQDTARAVRDIIAPVGTDEVPLYGRVVRLFRDAKTRIAAQGAGEAAARGTIDLGDLKTRVEKGRLPSRQGRSAGTAKTAQDRGVREGAVATLRNEATGTKGGAVGAAQRVTDSPRVRAGLETAAPDDAGRIKRSAQDVSDTAERARAQAAPASPTTTAEEIAQLRDIALGGALGNLGGAGRAAFIARRIQGARLSEGAARKTLEMLGDPNQFDQALAFMQSRGVDVGAFTEALAAFIAGRGGEQ